MSLNVYTARLFTSDPDRFDVTRAGAHRWAQREGRPQEHAPGHPFAPPLPLLILAKQGVVSWDGYAAQYIAAMRSSYRAMRPAWDALLDRRRVVLVCFCVDHERCHRVLLARILGKLGAENFGELEEPERVRLQVTLTL